MKNLKILVLVFIASATFIACTKETLHTNEIISRYKLNYFSVWDSESTPFRENASLYVNKETDSCLLVLKNKQGDTILQHLDKGIINMVSLRYKRNNNDWIVIKSDYGKTIYGTDTLGDGTGLITGSNANSISLERYYVIDRKRKALKKINRLGKKEFLNKIAAKFSYLKNCTIAEVNNTNTSVFKDTLDDKQVLYQLETNYNLEYANGKHTVEPIFNKANKFGLFKNRIYMEKNSDYFSFGEKVKVFFGKDDWQDELRYEIIANKHYKFNAQVQNHNGLPGIELFKSEIVLFDNKNGKKKLIKNFPKDSLFENHYFVFEKQRNGEIYIGINGQDRNESELFYKLDTIHWKLIKL